MIGNITFINLFSLLPLSPYSYLYLIIEYMSVLCNDFCINVFHAKHLHGILIKD